jgi:hypothetical protein
MEEDKTYSKRLLTNIKAEFIMDYIGSKKVPLDIEYQLLATVNGYQGDDESQTVLWSKSFPLSAKKTFKENSGQWSQKEQVMFPLSAYDAFTVRAKEVTGMDVTNELYVSMTGKVIAHTGKEDLETPFDVKLRIPLMVDTFTIEKTNMDPVKKSATEKNETQAPVNNFNVMLYGALLFVCIVGYIILLFFTREPNEMETLKKKVNSTLKNYGSRIVALQNIPQMNYRQHYKVHSMKDMIKIADELQKPIFYEVDSATVVKDYEFHIIEEDTIYSLFLDSTEA